MFTDLRRASACLVIAAALVLDLPGAAPARPTSATALPVLTGSVRIMEAGDSTAAGYGSSCSNGDRLALGDWLTLAGVQATFVGSQTGGCTTLTRHEGYGDKSVPWLADNIGSLLAANPADILILRIGINDLKDPRYRTAEDTLVDYKRIIDNARTRNPNIRILACKLALPNGSKASNLARASVEAWRFNQQLPAAVASYGDAVRVVPTDLLSTRDLVDGLHPSDTGYVKWAWIELHHNNGLWSWLLTRPAPQTDSYFDFLPPTQ